MNTKTLKRLAFILWERSNILREDAEKEQIKDVKQGVENVRLVLEALEQFLKENEPIT